MNARDLLRQADDQHIKAESALRQAEQIEQKVAGLDNPDSSAAYQNDANKLRAEAEQYELRADELRRQAYDQQNQADNLRTQKAEVEKQAVELDRQIKDLEGDKIGFL